MTIPSGNYNSVFSGIEAFKAVGLSIHQESLSPKSGKMEGRSYIQIKTNINGTKTAFSTSKKSEAASFAELANFVDKTLKQENLSKSDKALLLKVLGYEKGKVTLGIWDKFINTDKKRALDLANKLEKENKKLLDSTSVDDIDSLFPPAFSDQDEHV